MYFVIAIVINYIANVIDFFCYFIITCQLFQTFKSYKFHTFPTMPTVKNFRIIKCSIVSPYCHCWEQRRFFTVRLLG